MIGRRNGRRRLRDKDYQALAAFRHALRGFLVFSETAARESGLTPQQHQAILAIRASEAGRMSVGELAEHLLVRHHSAVELADRLAKADFVTRTEAEEDRRRTMLSLTPKATEILETLSATHLAELRRSRPLLLELLRHLEQG